MVIALRLAKAGLWGGDPARVLRARVDHVMLALDHDRFQGEYDTAWTEINRPEAAR